MKFSKLWIFWILDMFKNFSKFRFFLILEVFKKFEKKFFSIFEIFKNICLYFLQEIFEILFFQLLKFKVKSYAIFTTLDKFFLLSIFHQWPANWRDFILVKWRSLGYLSNAQSRRVLIFMDERPILEKK
mgnify:CR=1 FL=1